jgi:dihydrofolate reductase
MRTLTAGLFSSVDGVVARPDLWQFDSFDAELGAGMNDMMARVDTVLLGRRGYEEWAQYWPGATDPFASFINPVEKLVVSQTLSGDLAWENARLLEGDLETAVAALKETEGGEIAVCASISLVRQLLLAGLLDELTLMVHPVLVGEGRRLLEAGDAATRLELRSSESTSKGNLVLRYVRRQS